jgi:hypothetical protein
MGHLWLDGLQLSLLNLAITSAQTCEEKAAGGQRGVERVPLHESTLLSAQAGI